MVMSIILCKICPIFWVNLDFTLFKEGFINYYCWCYYYFETLFPIGKVPGLWFGNKASFPVGKIAGLWFVNRDFKSTRRGLKVGRNGSCYSNEIMYKLNLINNLTRSVPQGIVVGPGSFNNDAGDAACLRALKYVENITLVEKRISKIFFKSTVQILNRGMTPTTCPWIHQRHGLDCILLHITGHTRPTWFYVIKKFKISWGWCTWSRYRVFIHQWFEVEICPY